VRLGTTPSDIVLDESRARLYLVNAAANRVDVWDYSAQTLLGSIPVGNRPLAAALSMDNALLYVTNHDSSSLSVINLGSGLGGTSSAVALPAPPEGVAVGADGRAIISTDGSGAANTANTLLIYDPAQASAQQVIAVQFPPAPVTPPVLSAPAFPRPTTQFNGKLQRTPDGKYIIGVSSIMNNSATVVYQYEVDSGTVLQSRTVTGQSSVMAMAPDGASFMAGFTLYGTATLNAVAQQSTANAPFPMTGTFSTVANLGGSVFSPDGTTLYSAFNNSASATTTASTLLISDPHSLAISLGINLPESVLSKIVITSDGSQAWALSSSGMIHLPLGNLYNYPILMPQSTTVFLAQDSCNPGVAQGSLNINNIGGGTLTFAVPQGLATAIVATATSGLAPSTINFTMDPGRSSVVRTPGTNLYTGGNGAGNVAINLGTPLSVNLVSPNAINIPNTIRVFMNYRDSTQRGQIYPIPTVPYSPMVLGATVNEGLQDIVLDQARNLIYITNSGYNRIEVFDIQNRVFLPPIPVGQLPHQMAMGLDGSTLYVANTGGESIQIVDLDQQQVTGSIKFPPIPRLGNAPVDSVHTMALGLSGLEFVLLQPTTPTQTIVNGSLWQVIGNNAGPRTGTTVTGVNAAGAQSPLVFANRSSMIASADGTSIVLLGGVGTTYLYDGLSDSFTTSAVLFPAIAGFYGPVGAASDANFLLANGLVMNNSLTPIGGAATPGAPTITPPSQGGNLSSTPLRNVAAVAPIDQNNFARLTTPVRANLTTALTADVHTTLEVVNVQTGGITSTFRVPENPPISFFTGTPPPTPPRQMVIDSQGTAYAITLSGLSVIPLTPASTSTTPALAAHPIVNSVDGSTAFKPGSFVTINGSNLASPGTANALPAPTVLGGSCVVMNNVAIPLLQTASGQIAAQIPSNMRPGEVVMEVRSLATAQNSAPVVVAIQRP
jgi:DNA-binding beta-propeller fold protein YncE